MASNVLTERVDLRGHRTKTFEVTRGWWDRLRSRITRRKRFRTVAGVEPLHWKDAAGVWREVDLRWKLRADRRWWITEADFEADFDPHTFVLRYRSRTKGDLRMKLVSIDGVPPTPVEPRPFFTGDRMRIADIGSGVSLILVAHPHGPEFYRHLAGPTLPAIVWEIDELEDAGDVRTNVLSMLGHDNHADLAADRRSETLLRNQQRIVEVAVERTPDVVDAGRRSYTVTERLTGRTKWRDPETRAPEWRDAAEIRFPVFLDVQVVEDVATALDDGHSYVSSAQWFGAFTFSQLGANYAPAWRFQTVNVPQGATIDSATLRVDVLQSGTGTGTLHGQNVDSAPSWADASANGPVQMAKTTATTTFDGFGTTGQKTFDVKTIVQEIVNRAGWAANNDMRIGVGSNAAGAVVKFYEVDYGSGTAGRLTIDYTAGGGSSAPMFRGA
jgi:hypothetical protein